jgi:hypothetical protein
MEDQCWITWVSVVGEPLSDRIFAISTTLKHKNYAESVAKSECERSEFPMRVRIEETALNHIFGQAMLDVARLKNSRSP